MKKQNIKKGKKMNICFWLCFSAILVLFILEMINVIPVLKKDASEEEKVKRYPKTLILNSLLILFAGLMMVSGVKEKTGFIMGIAFTVLGLFCLVFSILNIIKRK